MPSTSRVAIALRMQDLDGTKYLAFHRELLGVPGAVTKERALAVAMNQGFDMARLEEDIASDEVRETLQESRELARALGISGTPGYVIGETIVPGAICGSVACGCVTTTRLRSGSDRGPEATMYDVTLFSGLGVHDSVAVDPA